MEICVKCNRSDEEVRLFDGVSINESIKICERCALLDGVPIIKIPSTNQLKSSEKSDHVYKRLRKISGIEEESQSRSLFEELKEIDDNPNIEKPEEKPLQLVDNFSWIIQRERRKKGFTPKQLASTIGESEMALKLIERNNLPENVMPVVRKLEQFFMIKLVKEPVVKPKIEERLATRNVEVEAVSKEVKKSAPIQIVSVEDKEKDVSYRDLAERTMKEGVPRKRFFGFGRKKVEPIVQEEPIKIEMPKAVEFKETIKEEPSRVLSFKKERMNEVTISDLRNMQRVVEEDFPKKSSQEIGEEQLGSFGKSSEKDDFSMKSWSKSYFDKRKERIMPKPAVPKQDGVPTLAELAEKKKLSLHEEDHKSVIGNEIELVEDVDVKMIEKPQEKGPSTKDILGDDIEILE